MKFSLFLAESFSRFLGEFVFHRVVNNGDMNKKTATSVRLLSSSEFFRIFLYHSFSIGAVENVLIFTGLRRATTLCFNKSAGIALFALLATTDAKLMSVASEVSLSALRFKRAYSSGNGLWSCKSMSKVERTPSDYLGACLRCDKVASRSFRYKILFAHSFGGDML